MSRPHAKAFCVCGCRAENHHFCGVYGSSRCTGPAISRVAGVLVGGDGCPEKCAAFRPAKQRSHLRLARAS